MNLKCALGLHEWSGCQCSKCGKTRDEGHDWRKDCEKCSKCGKTRDEGHDWIKDCEKCSKCGKTRQGAHFWVETGCSKCGRKPCDLLAGSLVPVSGKYHCVACVSESERISAQGLNEYASASLRRDFRAMTMIAARAVITNRSAFQEFSSGSKFGQCEKHGAATMWTWKAGLAGQNSPRSATADSKTDTPSAAVPLPSTPW